MRKIGIHKLGFESFNTEARDTNGMFTEIKMLMGAFAEHLIGLEYVNTAKVVPFSLFKPYDIIYVFNGTENSTSTLSKLKSLTDELNYVMTDTRFHDLIKDNEYIDNYFVQSPVKMFDKPTYNSMLHKLPIYEFNRDIRARMLFYQQPNSINKLIFGGSIRQREAKIQEYVLKRENKYYLKWEELGIDKRIPIESYREKLKQHAYGIVLINPQDVEIGNITWRYYEYIANNVLTFVDRESDPYNLLKAPLYMRVSTYREMRRKMKELSSNIKLTREMLSKQNDLITLEDLSGKTFVNSLLESREENVIRR